MARCTGCEPVRLAGAPAGARDEQSHAGPGQNREHVQRPDAAEHISRGRRETNTKPTEENRLVDHRTIGDERADGQTRGSNGKCGKSEQKSNPNRQVQEERRTHQERDPAYRRDSELARDGRARGRLIRRINRWSGSCYQVSRH